MHDDKEEEKQDGQKMSKVEIIMFEFLELAKG